MPVFENMSYEEYRKLLDTLLEGQIISFNRVMTDKLRRGETWGKTWERTGHVHIDDELRPVAICPECGEPFSLHTAEDGSCPVIIDAEFIKDELPRLPSGKE